MTSDVVVVVLVAACITVVHADGRAGGDISLHEFTLLGARFLGSVALGSTLGLGARGLRAPRQPPAHLGVLGPRLRAFGGDALPAVRRPLGLHGGGFRGANSSRQGEKFLGAIHQMSGVVYVIFFATAGAHLDIPLLRALWPVAVMLAGSRAFITWGRPAWRAAWRAMCPRYRSGASRGWSLKRDWRSG